MKQETSNSMVNDSFITELAGQIYERHGSNMQRVQVVFPNRRAGLYFRKALSAFIDKPIWMPRVISMEDFVSQFSSLHKEELLSLIFRLYEVYNKHQKGDDETFDQFFFWGEMILRDFEEIDQYLVNPEKLFTSIKTQKELDEEFYFLDEEERKIIQQFWASFLPNATKSQEDFLKTWKILLPIYTDFKNLLLEKGIAYGGLIYRQVAEQIEALTKNHDELVYFAGFNALTHTEEKIVKHFVQYHDANVVWDFDAYYFKNPKQEAGYFLRSYAKDHILQDTFPNEPPSRFQEAKSFYATGVSLEIGQTKALSEQLKHDIQDPGFVAERTVIVLPKEHMLFPVLHAIPDEIAHINITMGYPLKDTPVFSLLESVLYLQQTRKDALAGHTFYYKPVIELIEHPLLYNLEPDQIQELIEYVRRTNQITLSTEDIKLKHPIFKFVFQRPSEDFDYLTGILSMLYEAWKDQNNPLELEYISRFYTHLKELREMLEGKGDQLSYDFLIKLFRRLSRSLKIPFTGEPLSGLQIMGILETRNLDFDRVYILNMNEDSWPASPRSGSFIPFNIRKAFELPVFDHQDAIYSYLFYRLIQRAQEIHFYYNTVAEFNVNGEKSRLIQQLEVESGYEITHGILAHPVKTKAPEAISIDKTEKVRYKMSRFLDDFTFDNQLRPSAFAPSALNTYLDCRLKFYFKYVEQLYEPNEVQEEMDPLVFGNILHDSMELLYDQFTKKNKRKEIFPQDFFWIREGIDGAINQSFNKHYEVKGNKKFQIEGRSIIAAEVLKSFILSILKHDESYAPFRIVALEEKGRGEDQVTYELSNGKKVKLKGIIDRIDIKDGQVRVLDYKTGRDEKDFANMASLVDRAHNKRNKAVFQVFFYSYLFVKRNQTLDYQRIIPGIFNSKDLFQDDFQSEVYHKARKESVKDYEEYHQEYEAILGELLEEIFDPEVPFDQTTDEKKCKNCPYKEICAR